MNHHMWRVQRGGWQVCFHCNLIHQDNLICFQCRSAVISLLYRKAMRLTSAARQESTAGEIVNHEAIDAQKFFNTALQFHLVRITNLNCEYIHHYYSFGVDRSK